MLPVKRMKIIKLPVFLRGLAFLTLAILLLSLLIPLAPATEEEAYGRHLRNLLHVPLFAVVTFLLRFLQTSSSSHRRSLFACALVALLLGLLSEVAQSITGRTPAVEDLVADLSGILLACALLLRGSGRHRMKARFAMLLAGSAMFAFAAQPLAKEMFANRAKREAFPTLIDLKYSNGLWQAQGSTRLQVVKREGSAGSSGLEVKMADGSYEGLRFAVPKGVDTVGYSGLLIETDNSGEVFELGVRLDGKDGQRQYRSLMVPQGRSSLHTEWNSNRQGGGIVRLVFFTGEEQPARKFLLLDARLTQEFPTTLPADP